MNISAPFIQRPIATALLMVGLLLGGLVDLSAVAGGGAAERQLSDASGHRAAAGRRSADHGVLGGDAARAAVRPDPGPHPDDLGERARLHPDHPAVRLEPRTSMAPSATRCRRSMPRARICRRTCPIRRRSARSIRPTRRSWCSALTSDTLPLTTVDAYAENILLQKISQISGVGLVGIGGQQKPAIRVQVDPQALAARGISLEDVRTVLGQANVDLPKGTLNSPRQTYTLNTNDQLLKPDAYDDLIIAYRNGSPVRIRDIGTAIERAGERPARRLVQPAARHHPGDPAPARRQRHRDRRPDQGDAAACCRPRSRRRSRSSIVSDRTADHPRLGQPTCSSR